MTKKTTPPKPAPTPKSPIGISTNRPDKGEIGSNSMPKFETPPPPPKKAD